MKIIDDFLSKEELQTLQNTIIFGKDFPFYLRSHLNNTDEESPIWNWYGSHLIYENAHEHIHHHIVYNHTNKGRIGITDKSYYNLIWNSIFSDKIECKTLIRIKTNFYPNTDILREHSPHIDYDFEHAGAVFSLNTCDGYTKIEGKRVDSIENRIVFFDASKPHNSTTTSNAKGRFNINFNFL